MPHLALCATVLRTCIAAHTARASSRGRPSGPMNTGRMRYHPVMHTWSARLALLTVLLLGALSGTSRAAARPGIPAFSHIFTIVLENQEYDAAVGGQMPYLRTLIDRYGLANGYYAATHPSLPNYLALTGGDTFGLDGSDCSPGPECHVPGRVTNIGDQLEAAHRTWAAYLEGMPRPCATANSGRYAVRHDPFVYYDSIGADAARCNAHVLPYDRAGFAQQLAAKRVPDYAWISPDLCGDGHDFCSLDRLGQADTWLRANVPPILASAAWRQGGVLFILWDEGTTNSGWGRFAAGGHTAALVIGPLGRPGYRSSVRYDHYSYLRTVEDAWRLPRLGHAACACTPAMGEFFVR